MTIALISGCKDKPAEVVAVRSGSSAAGSAAPAPDIDALKAQFAKLMASGDDVGSVAVGAKLVAALRATNPTSHDFAAALTNYGMQLQVTGDWKTARRILEEALAHPAASTDHDLLAEIKFQLGNIYTELRETDKAIGILRSGIALATEVNGVGSEREAVMKEALASALDYAERYSEAEPLFREVLATYEKGDEPIRVGRALTNLGVNLEFQDRDPEALKVYLRAIKDLATTKGYARGALAELHSGLGRIYRRQKRDKLAEESFRRALAVRVEVLGPDHPLVAMDYHNLAVALKDKKQLGEARELCAKALVIRQAQLPADHPYRIGTEELCADLGVK